MKPNLAKTTPLNTVLPFYATGAMAFVVLCLLLVMSGESLTTHYFNPHLLSIVHSAALGWGTMVVFGAVYQLLPVLAEKDLYSSNVANFSWYFLCFGTIILVYSFWDFTTGWLMITGGGFVLIAVILYLVNIIKTPSFKVMSIQMNFILSSSIWLLITVIIGLLLAINLSFPFFKINHLEILKVHAHLGLGGWFLQLIAGVSSKLVPMFLVSNSGRSKLLNYALILQNMGLTLFLIDSSFFGFNKVRVIIYVLFAVMGIICWLLFLTDSVVRRIKKKIDVEMKHSFVSFICLLVAVCLLPIILSQDQNNIILLYGMLLFMGWITGLIIGKTFKTLPFMVWNEHYKKVIGKMTVPLPKDLYKKSLVNLQFVLYLLGLIGLMFGIYFQSLTVIQASTVVWLMLSVVYFLNVMLVIFHKAKINYEV